MSRGRGVGFAIAAVAVILLPRSLSAALPAAVLLGGFMSTLYPVCVAHAHMPANRVLAVGSRLILISGICSVLGPLIGASLRPNFGIDGVLDLMAAAALVLVIVAIGGSFASASLPHLERPFAILAPQAVPLAHDPLGASDEPLPPDSIDTAAEHRCNENHAPLEETGNRDSWGAKAEST